MLFLGVYSFKGLRSILSFILIKALKHLIILIRIYMQICVQTVCYASRHLLHTQLSDSENMSIKLSQGRYAV